MTSHKIVLLSTLLLAYTACILAQQCNSTIGFFTDVAEIPTAGAVFVNFTDYASWGTQYGPNSLNFTDEISIDLSTNNAALFGGGWGLGNNGNIQDYVAGLNFPPGNFSFRFVTPVTYFATRVNYSPESINRFGYPIMTLFNAADEVIACYNLETLDPIRVVNTTVRGVYNAQGISKVTVQGPVICCTDILVQYVLAPVSPPVESPVDTPTAPQSAPLGSPVFTPQVNAPKAVTNSPAARKSSSESIVLPTLLLIAATLLH